MTSTRKKAYLALFINVLLWGAALPIVKLALPYTTPYRWLFYRFLIATFASLPLLIHYFMKFKPTIKQIITISILELIGTSLVLGLLYEGLQYTSSLNASIISAMSPLFVILGGIFFLKERENRQEWIGFIIAFIGTIIITIGPALSGGKFADGGTFYGNGLIFVRNIAWAIYLIIAKRYYKTIPKPLVSSISFVVGMVSFGALSIIQTPSFLFADLATPIVAFAAIYMAIGGSLIAATLYLYGQNLIEIGEAAVFGYLEPLVSVPLAVLLVHEHITLPVGIGLVITAVGVYLAERRPRRV